MLITPVTLAPAIAPKETGGSPEFPDYPFAHMPRSQTPVVSRLLALVQTGLLPSSHWMLSAFGPVARTYLLTTIIHFSEFNDAACVLAFPLLRTPPLSGRTSVRLPTRWLAFGRMGLDGFRYLTHWVTLTCFKSCQLYSHVPSLARRDQWKVRRRHMVFAGRAPAASRGDSQHRTRSGKPGAKPQQTPTCPCGKRQTSGCPQDCHRSSVSSFGQMA